MYLIIETPSIPCQGTNVAVVLIPLPGFRPQTAGLTDLFLENWLDHGVR